MNYKAYVLFFSIFFFQSPYFSQNIDSLKRVVLTLQDTTQAETYGLIAKHYMTKDRQTDSCLKYNRLAFLSAQKHNSLFRMIKSKTNMAFLYLQNQDSNSVKKELTSALTIANQKKYSKGIIDVYNFYGYMYGMKNDLDKSAYYYTNTLKEYEKLNDFKNLALTYKNIAIIFYTQEQNNKMIEYVNKYIALIPKLKLPEDAETLVSLYSGAAESNFYFFEKENSILHLRKSLVYADSCLSAANKYQIERGITEAYFIKSSYAKKINNFTDAIKYAKRGLTYRNSSPEDLLFNTNLIISGSYLELNDLKNAQLYLDSCRQSSVSKMSDYTKSLIELEYNIYKKTGNHTKALQALEKLIVENNKILSAEKNKTINDLETKYQTELKEAKINELYQKSEIDSLRIRSLVAAVTIVVLLMLIVVFFYRQSTIKNKLKTIETEQRLNRARMNPHFFFNALCSLQNIALSTSKKDLVPSFILKFSKIMRQSLESTYNEMDTVENEILFLTDYMELQRIRSENRFDYSFDISDEIETNAMLIPGMILQPFVENSIEHGFKNIDYQGIINIDFRVSKNKLLITITDNGLGVKTEGTHTGYPSRATQIIKDRLFLLNQSYKENATFVLNKLENTSGFKVEINLPIIYKN